MKDRVAYGMALLFALCALLQLNDPDPVAWVFAYGYTAALTLAAARRALPRSIAALWAVVCAWSGLLVWKLQSFGSRPMGPSWQGVFADEVVREIGGLTIVITWCVVLVWKYPKEQASPTPG